MLDPVSQRLGLPASAGVTEAQTSDTITTQYNDIAAIEQIFATHGAIHRGGDRRTGRRKHGLGAAATRFSGSAYANKHEPQARC